MERRTEQENLWIHHLEYLVYWGTWKNAGGKGMWGRVKRVVGNLPRTTVANYFLPVVASNPGGMENSLSLNESHIILIPFR